MKLSPYLPHFVAALGIALGAIWLVFTSDSGKLPSADAVEVVQHP